MCHRRGVVDVKRSRVVVTLLLSCVLLGCGGETEQNQAEAQAEQTQTPQQAFEDVIAAYSEGDCEAARALVEGPEEGIAEFEAGCEEQQNLDQVSTMTPTEETLESDLDFVPDGASEVLRLEVTYTDERGVSETDDPTMVRYDDGWRLWIPGSS